MSFTSFAVLMIAEQFIGKVIYKYQEEKGSKNGAQGTPRFTTPSIKGWQSNFFLKACPLKNLPTSGYLEISRR